MNKQKNALISGARGFIGAAVAKELQNRGYTTLDPYHDNLPQKADFYMHFKWFVKELTKDCSAQLQSVSQSLKALELAAQLGCNKFIFPSSIMEQELWTLDNQKNVKFRASDVYAAAKFCARIMLAIKAEELGIAFIPVVVTNIYGAGEKSERFINSTLRKIKNKECMQKPLEFTAGTQRYDFVYISDAARALADIAEYGLMGRRYTLASGESKPLKSFVLEMLEELKPELSRAPSPIFGTHKLETVDLPAEVFDNTALRDDTGWKPQVSFRKGIRLTLDNI
ncbi:MAG: NAD(P)-dependent oxidoreductase [Helicobacteraceae bacterium]|jgi:nucleoside-diphosphate-sugar epimerase|nr:NAD(P)-dependent oxidoreductase [Helicobacteraceae bacterium]